MNSMMAVVLLVAVLAISVSSSNQGQYLSQRGGVSSWGESFGSQSAFGGNNIKNYGLQGPSRGFGSQASSPAYGRLGQSGWSSEGYSPSSGQQFSRNYSQRFPQSNRLSFGNQGFGGSYGSQRNVVFQGTSGSQGSHGRLFHKDRNQRFFGTFSDQGNFASAGQQRYGSSFNSQNVFNPIQATYGVPQSQRFSQQRGTPYGTQQGNYLSGFQG